jgi:anti-anti-sigma factor
MSAAPAQPNAWSIQSSLHPSGDATTLVVRGRLGSSGAAGLREAIVAASLPGDCLRLDLSQVDYISSAGLAALQECASRFHAAGGRLQLARASEPVRLALRLSGPIENLEHTEER